MVKPWRQIRAEKSKLSPERTAEIERAVVEESLKLSLRELREARGLTQVEVAQALEMAQGALSRLERRDDHLLSTLRRVVEALGGQLEISATFGDQRVNLL